MVTPPSRPRPGPGPKPGGPPSYDFRLGLWGSSGSGKTTYLGALALAADQARGRSVTWTLTSRHTDALSVLTELTHDLTVRQRFPAPTQSITELKWSLLGERLASRPANSSKNSWGGRGAGRPATPQAAAGNQSIEINLELLEAPGYLVDDNKWRDPDEDPLEFDDLDFDAPEPEPTGGMAGDIARLVDHLARCNGIIYLFDPEREDRDGDAFRHFNATLTEVQARTFRDGRMIGARLPHHFAVCVTKMDTPAVLELAMTRQEIEQLRESNGPIKLGSEIAEGLVDRLCRERPKGGARHVRDAIDNRFLPERVRYFATSAVGFWIGPDGKFDPAGYENVLVDGAGVRIRGSVRPMNVLEPLVWLAECIRKAQRAGLPT
ncbi:hypothetical protein [Frankia sp. QA3]|uniref:hypothetical protein n=1 Tax=Frankia sp. QA3 TaxID=710111 RepID=UPI000269C50A|nr:hypothetical protein [Frankia sp. QA3]EIV94358.1 hypothetical protein FraQA3DRAFT_4110 [Frankia sp. QA3]